MEYNGIKLITAEMLTEAFESKFEDGIHVYFENVTIKNIRHYIEHGHIFDEGCTEGICETKPNHPDCLQTEIFIESGEYSLYSPFTTYYDKEMDEWIDNNYECTDDNEWPDSCSSNYMHRHPDLIGGKLWFDEVSSALDEDILIEGKPFWIAVSLVLQNPELSTMELRELLADENLIPVFLDKCKTHCKNDAPLQIINTPHTYFVYEIGSVGYLMAKKSIYLYGVQEHGKPLDKNVRDRAYEIFEHHTRVVSMWRYNMKLEPGDSIDSKIDDSITDVEYRINDSDIYEIRNQKKTKSLKFKQVDDWGHIYLSTLCWMYGEESPEFKYELYRQTMIMF